MPQKPHIILQNALLCNNCGIIIISQHVHDYNVCDCGRCSVDGGPEYLKRSGADYESLSIVVDSLEDYYKNLDAYYDKVIWGTRVSNFIVYKKLINLEADHLRNILKIKDLSERIKITIEFILNYRRCEKLKGLDPQ